VQAVAVAAHRQFAQGARDRGLQRLVPAFGEGVFALPRGERGEDRREDPVEDGLLNGRQRPAALIAEALRRTQVDHGLPARSVQRRRGGEPFEVVGHGPPVTKLVMPAQRRAEQPPRPRGTARVACDLAQAVQDRTHPIGVVGRPEEPPCPPEHGVGAAEVTSVTGGLAKHVVGRRLTAQIAGQRCLCQFLLEMRLGRVIVAQRERRLAQEAVRPGQAPVVAEWPAHREALPRKLRGSAIVAGEAGECAGLQQGAGPDLRGARIPLHGVQGEQPLQLQNTLGNRPAPLPHRADRGGET
jgi:hypothetical protein